MQSPEIFKDAGATGRKEAGVFVDPICRGYVYRKYLFFPNDSQIRIQHKRILDKWAKIPAKDK